MTRLSPTCITLNLDAPTLLRPFKEACSIPVGKGQSETSGMVSGVADSAGWLGPDRARFDTGQTRWAPRDARDFERCRQCRFLWILHPERYEPEQDAIVRFCSEYPVRPVKRVEECIVP